MNRYPAWKYLLVVFVVVFGMIYASPNLFLDDPALQIAGGRTVQVNDGTLKAVETTLKSNNIEYKSAVFDEKGRRWGFAYEKAKQKFLRMYNGQDYGPYANLPYPIFDKQGKTWVSWVQIKKSLYVLVNGQRKFGPYQISKGFKSNSTSPIGLSRSGKTIWFQAMKQRKNYLIINGKDVDSRVFNVTYRTRNNKEYLDYTHYFLIL
mgnify:CR=1 FL=1